MAIVNKATYKIIIIQLCVFIAGLLGVAYITFNINKTFDNYKIIENTSVYEKNVMQSIENSLRQEQILTSMFIMSDEKREMAIYEQQIELNHIKLNGYLDEFKKALEKREDNVIFFQLKSNCDSVVKQASNAISIKKISGRDSAISYYIDAQYKFIPVLDAYIQKIHSYVDDELSETIRQIEKTRTVLSHTTSAVLALVFVSFIVSIYAVSKLSSAIENRKEKLEVEIEESKNQILKQNLKLIDFQKDTIYGMANLIECRNEETGEHVKRTSLYVELLAKKLFEKGYYPEILDETYIGLLKKAAPMHDVGKIMIPDSILTKPGKLTHEEFEVMKKHTSEGGRIVREILGKLEDPDYIKVASEVASYHHEKWNGSGYPCQLCGEKIPLCARIMAVADVFDALVSERCYKIAVSPDEAFGIMRDSAGTHFDPLIIDLLIESKEDILNIFSENA